VGYKDNNKKNWEGSGGVKKREINLRWLAVTKDYKKKNANEKETYEEKKIHGKKVHRNVVPLPTNMVKNYADENEVERGGEGRSRKGKGIPFPFELPVVKQFKKKKACDRELGTEIETGSFKEGKNQPGPRK